MHRTPVKDNIGYSVLTIYSKPFDCGGKCRFCFTDVKMPKSSLYHEDTNRGLNCNWDPICQLEENFKRLSLSRATSSKYGINIMGGSFTNYPEAYQELFIKKIYDFFNGFESSDLKDAKQKHLLSSDKVVMICIQTLPNLVTQNVCDFLKYLGVTEVQIGVESINETVLFLNRRPHTKNHVISATRLLKRSGFALTYHIMLGLIGSRLPDDINETITLLNDKDYSPDYIKIYPCIAVKGAKHNTPVNKWFELGWEPLTDEQTYEALKVIMSNVPKYIGVNRVQRLIKEEQILFGPKGKTNVADFKDKTNCIWLRSPMHNKIDHFDITKVTVDVITQGYGYYLEINFLNKYCLGYCRLEIIHSGKSILIRDMRILGPMVPVGIKIEGVSQFQHIGLGKMLIDSVVNIGKSIQATVIKVYPTIGLTGYFQKMSFVSQINGELILNINAHQPQMTTIDNSDPHILNISN